MTPDDLDDPPVRVGIGLVRRGDRFLIRQRPEGTAMAGYWEFPGGKCEPGEPPDLAATRECLEESGLTVDVESLRKVIRHRYPHARVELYYYNCQTRDPVADPDPGTGYRWVRASELPSLAFPEANAPILAALAREFAPPA
jgi:mutator protein MutT